MKRYGMSGVLIGIVLPPAFLLVYGSGYIAGGLGLRAMRPFAMTFWRFVIAAAVVTAIVLVRRTPWPRSWRTWGSIAVVGLLIQVVQFGGNYAAMALGQSAGLTALITGSSSLMMAIGAVPVLRERLTGRRLVGVVVGFSGVVVAVADHAGAPAAPLGVVAALAAAVGYAGGSLAQRRLLVGVDTWTSLSIQFLCALPVTFVLAQLTGGAGIPLETSALVPLAWIALVNSVAGMTLLVTMLKHHNAATVSAWSNLIPLYTALVAVPVLGQRLSPELIVGLIVALAGTALVVLPTRARQRARRVATSTDSCPTA